MTSEELRIRKKAGTWYIGPYNCDYSGYATQKAKGVGVLSSNGYHVPVYLVLPRLPREAIEKLQGLWWDSTSTLKYPLFVRPCPVTPRHGFVDSKVCDTFDALKQVWLDTLDADPKGELMLMKPIKAAWNVLITPTRLTIGKGHDGATAGKHVLSLPLVGVVGATELQEQMHESDIDSTTQDPYIEAVLPREWRRSYSSNSGHDAGLWYLTQLRGGPKIRQLGENFIPRDIDPIEHIYVPEPDEPLLDWEARTAAMGPNDIVVHEGGSLTSHYAIHAVVHEVPFLTKVPQGSGRPSIGGTLTATNEVVEARVSKEVVRGMAIGDYLGRWIGAQNLRAQLILGLVCLYNSHAMRGEYSKWLGIAAAIFLKLGTMALRGEARHVGDGPTNGKRRGTVYRRYAKHPLNFHVRHSWKWHHIFKHGKFQSGSVGGKNWAKCAKGIEQLIQAMQALAEKPSAKAVSHLVSVMNRTVDLAHNNGWWFNKFANGEVYRMVQDGHLPVMLECAQLLPLVKDVEHTIPKSELEARMQEYSCWAPKKPNLAVTVEEPRVLKVGQHYVTAQLETYDRLLKKKRKSRQVNIPSGKYLSLVTETLRQELDIEKTQDADIVVRVAGTKVPLD